MSLVFGAICPHPPIIVPTVGKPADLKIVKKTVEGMEKLAEKFAKAKPQTIIVISPHGPVDYNCFSIVNSPTLTGHFYNFGDFQTELIFRNDENLIANIQAEYQKNYNPPTASEGPSGREAGGSESRSPKGERAPKIPIRLANIKELDHGVLVPLYYLAKEHPNFKVVPLAFSYLDLETHFKFGQILKKAINREQSSASYGIVASGDLSHRLTPEAPAGYSPRGKEFDQKLVELLRKRDVKGILNMDQDLVEQAGECGYRSIIILLGALNGLHWQPEILSYEGPFGVGYLVANFKL